MKKRVKVSIFGVLGLALSLTLCPKPSSAETLTPSSSSSPVETIFAVSPSNQSTGPVFTPQATKKITYEKTYYDIVVPPKTYNYNAGGWKGTLKRTGYMQYHTTGITIGYYEGTVSCTGTCSFSDEIK